MQWLVCAWHGGRPERQAKRPSLRRLCLTCSSGPCPRVRPFLHRTTAVPSHCAPYQELGNLILHNLLHLSCRRLIHVLRVEDLTVGLLFHVLDGADRLADVKRCYTMRHALSLLDFDDETIDDLKRLLLRAAFSPTFLRCKEGRRYLAHLFTLEVCPIASEGHGSCCIKGFLIY